MVQLFAQWFEQISGPYQLLSPVHTEGDREHSNGDEEV